VIADTHERDRLIRQVADEAVDYLMNSVCEVFFFEEEPLDESNASRNIQEELQQPVQAQPPYNDVVPKAGQVWAINAGAPQWQDPVQEWSAWRSVRLEVAKDKLRRFVRRILRRD
jgi:hypothetical protein